MKKNIFMAGMMLAAGLAFGLNERGDINFTGDINLDGDWRIKGTKVNVTAAELNQLDSGAALSVGSLAVSGNANISGATTTASEKVTGSLVVGNGLTVGTNASVGATLTASDVIATDDVNVADDLVVTGKVTVGETAEITGIATFTSESVHNAGIDADYITVDANLGINSKTAGPLQIGTNTTTSINYGSASVTAHTFTTDGTGTGEIVLPNESIGNAELASGIDAAKLTGDIEGARLTNAVGVGAAMITITNYGVGDLYGTNVITFFGTVSYP